MKGGCMVLRNEDKIRLDISQIDKKLIQLLKSRWQIVVIIFTILSAFWGYLISNIINAKLFDANQASIICLILFLGFIFSATLLFIWRYFTHKLADEEWEILGKRFILIKVLMDANLNSYQDDEIREREREIRENDLAIQHVSEFLYNQFDDPNSDLTKNFFHLSKENR
jgi:ABC-type multidrug transport system fused ATPase/permease subunit